MTRTRYPCEPVSGERELPNTDEGTIVIPIGIKMLSESQNTDTLQVEGFVCNQDLFACRHALNGDGSSTQLQMHLCGVSESTSRDQNDEDTR